MQRKEFPFVPLLIVSFCMVIVMWLGTDFFSKDNKSKGSGYATPENLQISIPLKLIRPSYIADNSNKHPPTNNR